MKFIDEMTKQKKIDNNECQEIMMKTGYRLYHMGSKFNSKKKNSKLSHFRIEMKGFFFIRL